MRGVEQNGADLARAERVKNSRITTYVRWLDAALGGGIQLGTTTEIAGPSGIGKTQMCLSLAVNMQLPEELGGLGPSTAWFLDTEGGFTSRRLREIALSVARLAARAGQELLVDEVVGRVRLVRLTNLVELLGFSHSLAHRLGELEETDRPRLIVIDSVAFHTRHSRISPSGLTHFAQVMDEVAAQFSIAVVFVNQVSTKLAADEEGGSYLTLALGEAWTHAAGCRLHLFFGCDGKRIATLVKSHWRVGAEGPFTVTQGGLRGKPG